MRVAIIISRFNQEVTEALLGGALKRLKEHGLLEEAIAICWVPGAVEIPLMAQQYALSRQYSAIICLGAVIRGETNHYDYVCQQVSYGCQHLALTYHIPVIFGVLTTENEQQALDRAGGSHGNKGRDAADAAVEMIQLMRYNTPLLNNSLPPIK